ncbi:MAG: UDP-N-acetylglucosamine 2-epimerase (non-hydrolyzing) [Candidatus Korarchaeum sp.]
MLLIAIGTRPEIIKVMPVLRQLERCEIPYNLVWSGQHHDYEMSKVFFEELRIPEPTVYLSTENSTEIIGKLGHIIIKLRDVTERDRPLAIYGVGDTTTTLAAALVAAYERIPFIHDEAGMRSFDPEMLEETNRIIADKIARLHFSPTKLSVVNLLMEGIAPTSIKLVGSTAVDALLSILESPLIGIAVEKLSSLIDLNVDNILTLTIHRRENLLCNRLKILIKSLRCIENNLGISMKIVFPIHPHTKNKLKKCNLINTLNELKSVMAVRPLSYLEFLALLKKSKLVLTDSGGVQEEAFIMGKPIITLRSTTEWPETVITGYNTLIGLEEGAEMRLQEAIREGLDKELSPPDLNSSPIGDGRAAKRIVKIIEGFITDIKDGKINRDIFNRIRYIRNINTLHIGGSIEKSQDRPHVSIEGGIRESRIVFASSETDMSIERVFINLNGPLYGKPIQVAINWRDQAALTEINSGDD